MTAGLERDWNQEHATGKLDFLDRPDEQLRHAVISCLVSSHGRGTVLDLGCGRGHLLAWLRPDHVARYIGVDVSEKALAHLPNALIPAETICSPLEAFSAGGRAVDTVVCSELLCYIDDPGGQMARIVESATGVRCAIVTAVVPTEAKPNWRKGVEAVWAGMQATGWPLLERVRVSSELSGIAWDIAAYDCAGR